MFTPEAQSRALGELEGSESRFASTPRGPGAAGRGPGHAPRSAGAGWAREAASRSSTQSPPSRLHPRFFFSWQRNVGKSVGLFSCSVSFTRGRPGPPASARAAQRPGTWAPARSPPPPARSPPVRTRELRLCASASRGTGRAARRPPGGSFHSPPDPARAEDGPIPHAHGTRTPPASPRAPGGDVSRAGTADSTVQGGGEGIREERVRRALSLYYLPLTKSSFL